MIEDRNRTSHTYDEEVAVVIYQALPRYVSLLSLRRDELQAREVQRESEKAKGEVTSSEQSPGEDSEESNK